MFYATMYRSKVYSIIFYQLLPASIYLSVTNEHNLNQFSSVLSSSFMRCNYPARLSSLPFALSLILQFYLRIHLLHDKLRSTIWLIDMKYIKNRSVIVIFCAKNTYQIVFFICTGLLSLLSSPSSRPIFCFMLPATLFLSQCLILSFY